MQIIEYYFYYLELNVSENLVKMIPKIYGLIEGKKNAMKDLVVTESNGGLGGLTIAMTQYSKKSTRWRLCSYMWKLLNIMLRSIN